MSIGSVAKKINNDEKLIYCLCGDGELQEGQIWEAIMFAGAKKMNNLILTVDVNKQQICGNWWNIKSWRFKSKNNNLIGGIEVSNGNDLKSVIQRIEEAKDKTKEATHLHTFEYEMGIRRGFYDGKS